MTASEPSVRREAKKNQSACVMNLISDMIAFRGNLTSVSNVVLHNLHTLDTAEQTPSGSGIHGRRLFWRANSESAIDSFVCAAAQLNTPYLNINLKVPP